MQLAISGSAFNASISNDGSEILYLRDPGILQTTQAFTIHPDGTGNAQLTNFAQPVDEAVIAGSGTMAFAITGGRLEQVDVPSGAVQELIARTPVCNPVAASLAPGSIYRSMERIHRLHGVGACAAANDPKWLTDFGERRGLADRERVANGNGSRGFHSKCRRRRRYCCSWIMRRYSKAARRRATLW